MRNLTRIQRILLIMTGMVLASYLYSYAPWREYRRLPVKLGQGSSQYEWIHIATVRLGLTYSHSSFYRQTYPGLQEPDLDQRHELATNQILLETAGILLVALLFVFGVGRQNSRFPTDNPMAAG